MEEPSVYAEDIVIGEPYQAGSRLVTIEDIVSFATLWDPQSMHTEPERARSSPHGGIIASGIHTFGIFQRLAVDGIYRDWALIAGRAVRELRFHKPVRPGMVLSASLTVTDIEPRDASRSLVYKRGFLHDETGDIVFSFVAEAYVARRPDSTIMLTSR